MKHVLRALVWLLPASPSKNRVLSLLGHRVHRSAHAGPCLVWRVDDMQLAGEARVGKWNVFKNLRRVRLEEAASIGRLNVASAHPAFAQYYTSAAVLELAERSFITSRHQLDCSGGLYVGKFASIAGHQTRVMTHSIDVAKDAQAAYPVWIGDRSFVGARCLVLGGAVLPERSVLAAGSVLTRNSDPDSAPAGLWAGIPAKHKQPIAGGEWFDRTSTSTRAILIPETGEVIRDAF